MKKPLEFNDEVLSKEPVVEPVVEPVNELEKSLQENKIPYVITPIPLQVLADTYNFLTLGKFDISGEQAERLTSLRTYFKNNIVEANKQIKEKS